MQKTFLIRYKPFRLKMFFYYSIQSIQSYIGKSIYRGSLYRAFPIQGNPYIGESYTGKSLYRESLYRGIPISQFVKHKQKLTKIQVASKTLFVNHTIPRSSRILKQYIYVSYVCNQLQVASYEFQHVFVNVVGYQLEEHNTNHTCYTLTFTLSISCC